MKLPDAVNRTSAGVLAVLLVLLLTGACGRGGEPADEPQTRPAPEEGVIRLGPATSEDAADELGWLRRQGTDADRIAAGDDPAAVVRALLAAVEQEDYESQLTITTDGAWVLMRARDIIRQENARRGAETNNEVGVDAEPSLLDASADEATVDVHATISSTVAGQRDAVPTEALVRGPVTLRRSDGRWLISDLAYAGRSLGAEFRPVNGAQVVRGLRLHLFAVQGYKEVTAALVRFVSEGTDVAQITVARAVLTYEDGSRDRPLQVAVGSGENPTVFIGFPHRDAAPTELVVRAAGRDADGRWDYRFEL